MYTLFRGLWSYLSQKDQYSVLILGLDGAGKTTYLEQTKVNFVPDYKATPHQNITTTVGLNLGEVTIDGVRLKFWDLGGQEELQSLWDKYYSESHCVIYVIDSVDVDRFDESKEAFGMSLLSTLTSFLLIMLDKMIRNHNLDSVPLLILANKQDAEGAFPVAEVNKIFYDSMRFVGQRDCTIRGVSALKGDGVPDGIHWITQKMKENISRRPPSQGDNV